MLTELSGSMFKCWTSQLAFGRSIIWHKQIVTMRFVKCPLSRIGTKNVQISRSWQWIWFWNQLKEVENETSERSYPERWRNLLIHPIVAKRFASIVTNLSSPNLNAKWWGSQSPPPNFPFQLCTKYKYWFFEKPVIWTFSPRLTPPLIMLSSVS